MRALLTGIKVQTPMSTCFVKGAGQLAALRAGESAFAHVTMDRAFDRALFIPGHKGWHDFIALPAKKKAPRRFPALQTRVSAPRHS
jgi:hypothetical protein